MSKVITETVTIDGDLAGIEVSYSPTRSRIMKVDVVGAADLEARIVEGELRFRIEPEGRKELQLRIESVAAPLRNPMLRAFRRGIDLWSFDVAPDGEPLERNRILYAKRLEWSNRDEEEAFLFDLDRFTLTTLLPFCDDLKEKEKKRHLEEVPPVLARLQVRLEHRFNAQPVPAPLPEERCRVAFVSSIFRRAMERVDGNVRRVRDALEAFAAGRCRNAFCLPPSTGVPVLPKPEPEITGEPDSWLVFLFGEFALFALDHGVDPSLWKPLLRPLVKMQDIYLARWKDYTFHVGHCVTDYGDAPWPWGASIKDRRRILKAIDRRYRWAWTRAAIEHRMNENIRGAASCFRVKKKKKEE